MVNTKFSAPAHNYGTTIAGKQAERLFILRGKLRIPDGGAETETKHLGMFKYPSQHKC